MPVVFTWARMQALICCWQSWLHWPYSHSGAMPSSPGNGIGLPLPSFSVMLWVAGSAQRTMYEKVFCPSGVIKPFSELNPLIEFRPFSELSPLRELNPFSELNPFRELSPLIEFNPFSVVDAAEDVCWTERSLDASGGAQPAPSNTAPDSTTPSFRLVRYVSFGALLLATLPAQ